MAPAFATVLQHLFNILLVVVRQSDDQDNDQAGHGSEPCNGGNSVAD